MKKIVSLFLTLMLLFSFTACSNTPEKAEQPDGQASAESSGLQAEALTNINATAKTVFPQYDNELIQFNELSKYVIVCPASYNEYQMYEVELLRDTVKTVLGFELEIISDAEPQHEHEIILASSSRANGVEDTLTLFESGLDYLIGVVHGNIILGGNNYYADMRAIYDFINNYLGYNDIDKIYSEPKNEISSVSLKLYEKPLITLLASNFSVSPFTEQYAVRDMAEAHFNMVAVAGYKYTEKQFRDFAKWCARYEIFIITIDRTAYSEVFLNCPVLYGCLTDEPTYGKYEKTSAWCTDYYNEFSKYGLKPCVNTFGSPDYWKFHMELNGFFDETEFVSFDQYFSESVLTLGNLTTFEYARIYSQRNNKDMWSFIEAYNVTNREQNTNKMFRWATYVSLSFGAKGILYFQYGDASPNYKVEGDWTKGSLVNWDFTKNQSWYDAKRNNEELLKLAEIYCRYTAIGASTITRRMNDVVNIYLEDQYPYLDKYITDFKVSHNSSYAYLAGLFEENDGNGKAFTIMNLEDLDDTSYDDTPAEYVKIKINGDNVKFYLGGELQSVEKDSDGYYLLNLANGYCWFITID